jgi:phage terminase small subunit
MPVLSDPKHEAFARSVAAGASKRDAAIQAGYAASDASSRGSKLAARPEIKDRIAELSGEVQAAICEKLAITTERIAEEYAKIAFAECDLTNVTPRDKKGALDSLAKTLGMFQPEKVEHEHFVKIERIERVIVDPQVLKQRRNAAALEPDSGPCAGAEAPAL